MKLLKKVQSALTQRDYNRRRCPLCGGLNLVAHPGWTECTDCEKGGDNAVWYPRPSVSFKDYCDQQKQPITAYAIEDWPQAATDITTIDGEVTHV